MPVKEIILQAAYGDEHKKVVISEPNGGGGGSYHINIDRYHHGQMFKRNGEWVGYFAATSELQWSDVLVIGEIIDSSHS